MSCIEHQGSTTSNGYGRVRREGRNWLAHRWAFAQAYPASRAEMETLCVCHRCDNRRCINPEHLFLGTYKDNHDDMVAKGRRAPQSGESNGAAKLFDAQVAEVFRLREQGSTQQRIADQFGVTQAYVSKLLRGVCRAV